MLAWNVCIKSIWRHSAPSPRFWKLMTPLQYILSLLFKPNLHLSPNSSRKINSVLWSPVWAIFVITIKNSYTSKKSIRVHQHWEFMPFNLAWNSTTDIFDQHSLFCHFVLHIAVNTNVSEGFVITAIWSTYMEGRPADRFVLHIAVKPIIRYLQT